MVIIRSDNKLKVITLNGYTVKKNSLIIFSLRGHEMACLIVANDNKFSQLDVFL